MKPREVIIGSGRKLWPWLAMVGLIAITSHGHVEELRHMHGGNSGSSNIPLMINSQVPFATLMSQAMERMDQDMAAAPMTGDPDHDFLAMMIPHHQGAVDMAKIVLLYGKDPRVKNLAQGIIADQEVEIELMRNWLAGGTAASSPHH